MEQKKSRAAEIIRFALTGGVCFVVELAVLILLKGKFGVDTLIATPIAFLISVILNYLLCVVWVFRGAKNRGAGAKAGFLITSLIGLGLNELLMLLFRLILGEDAVILTLGTRTINMYVLNKCLATLIVMIWNYFSKRAVLYRRTKQ
ncbi:MAG: GtrA family protein [Clostridia bacterium]|jgi:putative flippase GtrA|nr:GtrA family protein [Clostridia bacterium]